MRKIWTLVSLLACLSLPLSAQKSSCAQMALGQGASLNGFLPFPTDNLWNQSVSNASVDPNSDAIINFIGASTTIHPDFGAGLYQGSTIGIPYVVVSGSPFVSTPMTWASVNTSPRLL